MLVGRYVLVEEIGRGGFGTVFRARQTGLDEDVAIKVVRPHVLDDPDLKGRFEREIYVAKQLRHPKTIRIIDVAETEVGLPFYVMEFVEGASLGEVLEQEYGLTQARTKNICTQILKGLAEAHSRGVVHRDLKPENVLLCDIFGERDYVKILDFGIAKALQDEGQKITRTDMIMGTPNYMSPEQALGQLSLDGRSDLYTVGLIIAECLLGDPLVDGDTMIRVIATHASHEPLVLPKPVLESSLGPIIKKATEKDPDDRYGTAGEMAAALEAVDAPESKVVHGTMISTGANPDELQAAMADINRAGGTAIESPSARARSAMDSLTGGRRDVAFAETRAAARAKPTAPIQKQSIKVWAIPLLAVLLFGGIGAFVLLGSSDDVAAGVDEPSGETDDPGEEGEVAIAAEPEPEPEPEPPVEPEVDEAAAAAEAAEAVARANTRVALALATERIGNAVPSDLMVSFGGLEQVTVGLNGEVLGVTPFDAAMPMLQHEVELTLERSGYRSDTVMLVLSDDDIDVTLRRERRRGEGRRNPPGGGDDQSGDGGGDDPPAGLFGQAPIDDGQ